VVIPLTVAQHHETIQVCSNSLEDSSDESSDSSRAALLEWLFEVLKKMDLVDLIKNVARKIEVPRPPTIADTIYSTKKLRH